MTNPLPNIAYEGEPDICNGFLPKAKQLLNSVLWQMSYNKLGVYRGHMRLSDTAYCYVVVAGGVSSICIVADGQPDTGQTPVSQHWKTPDFLSGVVVNGQLTTTQTGVGLCHSFLPTPDCGRLFGLNAKGQPPTIQDSAKLAVEGYPGIADNDPNIVTRYVQSGLIRPTQWTGTMRLCIQALMGFGKPGKKSIYARTAIIPPIGGIKPQPKTKPTAYEQQVADTGRQIRYDYRFYRTHGLVKAADEVWWLVEIGMTRGVIAMPLPLYVDTQPASSGKSAGLFRAKLAQLNDTAAKTIIDTLGGFPTGESFPTDSTAFEAWVKAGKILSLLTPADLSAFYGYQPYSSLMGWAFSDSGHEAHNTAWDYADSGVIWGIHDSIAFTFGATVAALRSEAAVKDVRQALQGQEKANPKTYAANIYKLRRLSNLDFDAVVEELNRWDAAAAYALLNGMTGAALSVATATRTRAGLGKLWDNAKFAYQVQLKFPEPALKCLDSFDFNPIGVNRLTFPAQDCDTTVHVFFVGEQLHWVKYYCSAKPVTPEQSSNDFEDCMLSGSWSSSVKSAVKVPKMLYTSAIDDRREVGANENTTTIKGEDLGYTLVQYGDWIPEVWMSTLSRYKTFLITTKTVSQNGPNLQSTVLVPFGDRACYYYAVKDGFDSVTRSERQGYQDVQDPTTATGNRKWIQMRDQIPECGNPDARRCKSVEYNPGGCSDVADEGQWVNKCDNFEDMAYAVTLPDLPQTSSFSREEATLSAKLVSGYNGGDPVTVQQASSTDVYWGEGHWFIPSPDPETDWRAWLWTTHNALGDTEILQYVESPDGFPVKIQGSLGFAELDENERVTFVGVV